jgi:hypothetical protein
MAIQEPASYSVPGESSFPFWSLDRSPCILCTVRAFFVVVAALAGGSLVGCAAVAGLDQLSRSSCTDDCDAGASADVTVDQGSEGSPDVVTERVTTGDATSDSSPPADSGGDAAMDAPPAPESGVEGGADAKSDAPAEGGDGGAGEASVEAGPEAGPEAGAEAGCGPTNTTSNCGKCGNVCTPTGATADLCNGLSCTYTCTAGHSDCNSATAPDLDGCECATPGCCSGSCQTVHTNGVGEPFYDCFADGTYTEVTAIDACSAYATSIGGSPSGCSGGWTCSGNPTQYVCYGIGHNFGTCANYCWLYTGTAPDGGPGAGQVIDCSCPGNYIGPWD